MDKIRVETSNKVSLANGGKRDLKQGTHLSVSNQKGIQTGDRFIPHGGLGGPDWAVNADPDPSQYGGDLLNLVWKSAWERKSYSWYRPLLRKAVPFTFDKAATRLITELASKPEKCPLYRTLARLPYEAIWVEYDYVEKVRTQMELGSRSKESPYNVSEEPVACGYLIERLSETRWRLSMWTQMLITAENRGTFIKRDLAGLKTNPGDTLLETMPIMMILDTETHIDGYRTLSRDPALTHGLQDLIDTSESPSGLAWGVIDKEKPTTTEDGKPVVHIPQWATRSVCFDLPPDWEKTFQPLTPHQKRTTVINVFDGVAQEYFGILRWVCAALATINSMEPDGLLETKEKRPPGSFRASGQLRPYKTNRHITIKLPGRSRPTTKHLLKLFQGAKRRMARHHVRGFWRTTAKQVSPGERWQWLYSARHREMRWIIWVNEFDRGDAALGYVQRDYTVTK